MPAKPSFNALLSDSPKWSSETAGDQTPQIIRTYADGLNHDVALVQVGAQQYVVKLFNEPDPKAIIAQQWATQLNVAPTISYVASDYSYCVMQHIEGDSIMPESISNADLAALAMALKRVHSTPAPKLIPPDEKFDLIGFCEHYLSNAGARAFEVHQQVIPQLKQFMHDTTPRCFCHNDLVVANCFIVGKTAQFIDWEYAQLNNPWFDLAAIIYYLQISQKQAAYFLESYQAGWSELVGSHIYYNAQLALLWADMLWHLAKFGDGFWSNLDQKFNDLQQLSALAKGLSE